MNDSYEYAQMIEFPLSSCEYSLSKKRKFFKKKKVVKTVNEKLEKDDIENQVFESQNGDKNCDKGCKNLKNDTKNGDTCCQNDEISENSNSNLPAIYSEKTAQKESRLSKIISAQIIAVVALVSAIVLTNVFWENSAMNTLFKSVFAIDVHQNEQLNYNDFNLTMPAFDQSAVSVSDGSIIITGEYSIYPVCEGKVSKIERAQDGTYTVTLSHSENFSSVTEGLDMVYFSSGEQISSVMPLGYSKTCAKVLLYSGDSLLTDYASVENSIVFNK